MGAFINAIEGLLVRESLNSERMPEPEPIPIKNGSSHKMINSEGETRDILDHNFDKSKSQSTSHTPIILDQKQRKKIPTWLLWTGGGLSSLCLIGVIIAAVVVILNGWGGGQRITETPTSTATFSITSTASHNLTATQPKSILSIATETITEASTVEVNRSIAYIWYTDEAMMVSYGNLLSENGYQVDFIHMDEVGTTQFNSYELILIGPDTIGSGTADRWYNAWGDETSIASVNGSGIPVLGIGEGGMSYFGRLNFPIGGGHSWHGEETSIYIDDPDLLLFNYPNSISDREVELYREPSDYCGIYSPDVDNNILYIGREPDDLNHYPIISYKDKYILWCFEADTSYMTADGQSLFINIIDHLLNLQNQ
jgi:hypothetical protein